MRMGLLMGGDYAQRDAQSKGKKRNTLRMTVRGSRGIARRMPDMTKEAIAAYDAKKIRAAIRAVMDAKRLKNRPWADKAGISPGSLAAFLKGETESMLLAHVVRLAWAAGVTVSELIGEPQPVAPAPHAPTPPTEPPSESAMLQMSRILLATEERVLALQRQKFDLERRIAELEKRLPGA